MKARTLKRLINKTRLYCLKPGGRFGEDSCGECANCKLDDWRRNDGKIEGSA